MTDDPKARADARLEAALDGATQRDPRPYYRHVLRYLKDRAPDAFQRSYRYFEEELVPRVAGEADPLEAWLDYGRALAGALGDGRTVEVDSSGRARSVSDLEKARGLVLHIPDSTDAPLLVLRCPREPSPAQKATHELLVEGRPAASAYS